MITLAAKVTRSRMRELSKQGGQAAQRRNVEIARTAEKIAENLCPVATGALKATIRVEETRTSASLKVGDEKVDYAPFVEYGTVYQTPQPFIRPAIEKALKQTRNRAFKMYKG